MCKKYFIRKIISLTALLLFSGQFSLYAQSDKEIIEDANALASGNFKDAFKSFFQLAFDHFTAGNKEINFSSNPYAVMAQLNPELLNDRYYTQYKNLRKLNFTVAGKLDSNYRFNGFSSGIKYALINRRDETISRAFIQDITRKQFSRELFLLNDSLQRFISSLFGDMTKQINMQNEVKKFMGGQKTFASLDPELQKKMTQLLQGDSVQLLAKLIHHDPDFNVHDSLKAMYNDVKQSFNNKLLWTFSLSDTTYQDQFMFQHLAFTTEVLKGIVKKTSVANVEFSLLSALHLHDDTVKAGRDLHRSVWSIETGLNLILKMPNTQKSFFECKFSAGFQHRFNGLYLQEKRDRLSMNTTLRFRVMNDIWVPMEIRYDPENGHLTGFLTVKANFTGLHSIFGR